MQRTATTPVRAVFTGLASFEVSVVTTNDTEATTVVNMDTP